MEFVDGVNLRQAMQTGRFSPAEALSVVPKFSETLQYAHERSVLHRDIEPENILLDSRGGVKTADFGITKLVEAGRRLGFSESAVKVAVHRMRKRFRELLRDEVCQTLAEGDIPDAELRYLAEVLSRHLC